jgi:choline monooxygenase
VIGVGSSIPNLGDAKSYNLLGIPLMMVRGKDEKIRVFHNVCSHRGFKLLEKPCTLKNIIRCPYHSWSYDFEGNLISTPHIGGLNIHQTEKFEKSQSNLKEVRSKIWMDIVFININSNEINFEEYIKPLEKRWSKFINYDDHKQLVHSKDFGYFNLEVKSNWKFAVENYCESYHLPTIHPELNKVSNISDHYHIQGLPNRFAGQGSKKYEQLIEGNIKFNTFKNCEKSLIKNSEYIALFPNVMIGLHLDHFYVFWLEPLAFNRTKEHMEMYYIGEESANSEELKELRKENSRFWKDVMLEDVSAIEGMQKGRSSPVYNGGNFSPVMDNPTHQFHKWIAGNLI